MAFCRPMTRRKGTRLTLADLFRVGKPHIKPATTLSMRVKDCSETQSPAMDDAVARGWDSKSRATKRETLHASAVPRENAGIEAAVSGRSQG